VDSVPSRHECGDPIDLPRGVHERPAPGNAVRFLMVNRHGILVFQMALARALANDGWRRDLAAMLEYWDP